MKFYVASSFKNIEKVRYVSEQLKHLGFTHTYDWTNPGGALTLERLKEIGQQERNAVIEADLVIVILPAGKGSHIELGIALGLGKKVYLYAPDDEVNNVETTSTFYQLDEIDQYIGTLDELIDYVTANCK
ncbi:nucleoside 2-deoxyribosyltransferase [Paenibacillus allorhizosphaerae]|uniref:Group-specific protein n=1 Tax=Paenibacillus allorhizosphaerae TaxID=2849866 RepID=A0ABN7TPN7_9BACL|nr:nucleoside 2-deoxyribosyltransferase [Paenibacillus allorhizosphaerae]CAG7645044.1 hypothetical protein PAECIP111802_03416 [Paenibacillus allorhizosphaerae]